MRTTLEYVEPQPRFYDGWRALYGVYGDDMGDPVDDVIALSVWSWLLGGTHRVAAILAVDRDGGVVGFVHYRPFPRTLHANEACFLDDLYVAPDHRGRGIAAELVRRVCEVAAENGWTEVRWVTGSSNAVAQRLYERIATRMELITYRIPLKRPTDSNAP
ncbi:MAG: GNAT family N-acetyltransferase [Candidatus Eremiobacteraeota bacterium]|nr:GNAT family N-acetyltransferase [Candidatus Eremiobacteraeota bacterium]